MKKFLLVCLLFPLFALGASSERLDRETRCPGVAKWAEDVYDQIKQNNEVIINGIDEQDAWKVAFIRQWIKDGKSVEDLSAYVLYHCLTDKLQGSGHDV